MVPDTRRFQWLPWSSQTGTVLRLAALGWSEQAISHATGLTTEEVRRRLIQRLQSNG